MGIDIKKENSILLCIDIQEKLVNMLNEKIKEKIKRNSTILSKTASILDIKTIITEQYPKGLGFTINNIKENIQKETTIVEKCDFNALKTKEIEKEIKEYKNIFVFGIETHICVFQSVINLLKEGYNVFVVKDICASREKEEHKASLNLMEKEGAKIITTEMILFEFLKTSKHPKFKEIQALIKK